MGKWAEIIPIRKAILISEYFKINLDYLFGNTNIKSKNKTYSIDLNISGRRIKKIRNENGLTLRELANILNTSSSTISSYESGKTLILTAFAYQISKKYYISMDYLLGLSDKMYYKEKVF